ncbi:glycosyltransferase [Streptomyces phage Daubenski]|uniref:Glycosyltransferase n=1 Tax=Streptomyces phage Daubenski TaxID=2653725 RepID=A0A5Q2WIG9_9CAUD|nr:glycosyltransferase [Streptomyces phage Daubenski]QGH76347.1 glycosyltransferase [Streptomyces phage Daubenski]
MRRPKILVIVPTRGRPDKAERLYHAIYTTAEVDTIFCVDNDDPKLIEYQHTHLPLRVGTRKRLVGTLNEVAKDYAEAYDIIGFLGDDTMPNTYRWDVEIQNHYKKNLVAYANDGHQRAGLPTGVFLDSRIVKTLGYMVPPTFIHLFADNYWKALGEALGTLTYLEHVDIEHLHPYAGKAEHDKTYEEANAGPVWENDERAFNEYVRYHLAEDVERLA